MHQPPPPPPPPPPQHMYAGPHQDRLGAGGLAPASSFDSAFGLPPMSNPFMVPIASSSASSTSTHAAAATTMGGGGPSTPTSAVRADSPTARMNPQAPTFDPSLAYRK